MTFVSTTIAPVNSILFVSGRGNPRPPSPWRDAMIIADSSCILVRCYPEQDGATEVTLGRVAHVNPGFEPTFVGELATERREVVVSSVEYERILETAVPNTQTKIRIWLSHPRWPEKIVIGFD